MKCEGVTYSLKNTFFTQMLLLLAACENTNCIRYLSLYYWQISTLTEDKNTYYVAAIYPGTSLTGKVVVSCIQIRLLK